ncbi:dephospho-CoA kinase [Leucobacter exalbidus]|uniref:Dephospho-CoA kinase n=1 Tax=Leucobacter exalbidus TaxID=662960 RepID=A0A940PLS0_9MICO|nr:dephospho-CoA kinase [Leucobacter exalbidus]MBP1325433.1 dephospho-CoA kinase [Leucobacter exalbidus]
MLVVALTGGIAAGKSTIGSQLEGLGALRIDADQLAREAVAPGSPGLARVIARFGDELLTAEGALDRAALGEIVFSDPAALAELNAIVHPEVRRLMNESIADARQRADIVVYEIPLLAESEARDTWDVIVTAEAPIETRVARMQQLRAMSEEAARARISHQASESDRRAIADVVIDTGGTPEDTSAQVLQLWQRLQEQLRAQPQT